MVLRGDSVGWLKRCMSITIRRTSDRNEGGKIRLMVYPSMVFDPSYVGRCKKRMKIKQKYLLECEVVPALPVAQCFNKHEEAEPSSVHLQ